MIGERLAPLDLAFWRLESPAHPMHLGALAFFAPGDGTRDGTDDGEGTGTGGTAREMLALLRGRTGAVPRLAERVRDVLLPVGAAAWTRDPRFDIRRQVRHLPLRTAGPPGGFPAAAVRAAAGLMARPLDREHPPWEAHLLTGDPHGSFAVLVKVHHALADGMGAVALGAALLDGAGPRTAPPGRLPDRPPPGPATVLDAARDRVTVLGRAIGVGTAVLRAGRLGPSGLPALTAAPSGTRRVATAVLDLEDVRRVRKAAGGTANDVLLAVVAGALRRWAHERGEPPGAPGPRALVPVSRYRPGDPAGPGNSLSGYLLELPVGLDDPRARLAAVRTAMDRNRAAGPLRGAGAVALIADGLPPLVHRLGTPLAGGAARMLFDLLVTTVPLPRRALTLGGRPLVALHPLAPLARGQSLSVAMTPYEGQVYVGLLADGAAVPDLERLSWSLGEELLELLELSL
ncbi:wax ester/triacylglycerol synthase family O-acyltransferase [Streptomyces sp. NPDC000594]|uniref:wax ester/triacylglycerol synthase family O-acyltransferase n=1 Tax=Streptomyces sp. NPDC000594 TaxID=3154261 RepID=UPI003320C30B